MNTFDPIPNRDAHASIRGYFHQALLSVQRWLHLGATDELHLEAGEDIDQTTVGRAKRLDTQLKDDSGNITLNDVRATFANAVETQAKNPGLQINTEYVTTAGVTMEQLKPFDPRFGIDAWNLLRQAHDVNAAKSDLDKLRAYLNRLTRPGDMNANIWQGFTGYIQNVSDEDLLIFVKRFAIRTSQPHFPDTEAEIDSTLSGTPLIANDVASEVRKRLHYHVMRLLSQPGEKKLIAADLAVCAQRPLSDDELRRYEELRQDAQAIKEALGRIEPKVEENLALSQDTNERVRHLTSGDDLSPEDVFSPDPATAFDTAVGRAVGRFDENRYAPRPDLERTLDEFYASSKSLFILVGESGEGKTQAARAEAKLRLKGQPRCFMSAQALLNATSVNAAIATALTREAKSARTPEQISRAALEAARRAGRPFVLIADNIIGDLMGAGLAERLATIISDAEEAGVKIVLTSRYSTWQYVSSHFEPDEGVFLQSRPRARVTSGGIGAATGAEQGEQVSYHLGPLSDGELSGILTRRFGNDKGEAYAAILGTSAFAALRNASLLDVYCKRIEDRGWELKEFQAASTDDLLTQSATDSIRKALANSGLQASRQAEVRLAIAEAMWTERHEGTR